MDNYPDKDITLYAPKARIIVVDDNNMNLKVITKLLKATKIQIDEAESGSLCLEMLNKKHYDLVLMDHLMPMMDGVEALHRIREMDSWNRHVKVIALTANTNPGAGEFYINEGFADYIQKPVKPNVLKSVILKFLDPELLESHELEVVDDTSDDAEKLREYFKTLPAIEGMDWELAVSHFNDAETMKSTLHDFYKTATRDAGRLNLLLNSLHVGEDIDRYRICVHSMKSIARLVGLAELADKAQKLEDAAQKNDIQYINDNHMLFVDSWMEYKARVAPYIGNVNVHSDIDRDTLIGHLDRLASASEMLDVDVMDPVAKVLEEYNLTWEGGQEKLDNLLAAVVDLDTDTIFTLVNELKAECMREF